MSTLDERLAQRTSLGTWTFDNRFSYRSSIGRIYGGHTDPDLDPDAIAYIAAVEAADGQALEAGVQAAYNDFFIGCKEDGIWDAIKACCILAGARTLDGALVPLVGGAPTNFNFVSGDYDRKTGLIGDGSTKYLDSNRTPTATSPTDYHQAVYLRNNPTLGSVFVASDDLSTQRYLIYFSTSTNETRVISGTLPNVYLGGAGSLGDGFKGASRDNSSTFDARTALTTSTISAPSGVSTTLTSFVFASNRNGSAISFSNARLAFYSIGESLDLAALDTRVSNLITAIGAAIV